MSLTLREIGKSIEHAALKPDVTKADIAREITLAMDENVRALVVHPNNFIMASSFLSGITDVLPVPVADFPHGRGFLSQRRYGLNSLYMAGAEEVDIVSQYQYLKDNDFSGFQQDLDGLVNISISHNGVLKIILEVDELTKEQIETATHIIMEIAALKQDAKLFIKTKTGFAKEVKIDNLDAVKLIAGLLKEHEMDGDGAGKIRVKASGGVKNLDTLLALKKAGAHTIGTSSLKVIMDEARAKITSKDKSVLST